MLLCHPRQLYLILHQGKESPCFLCHVHCTMTTAPETQLLLPPFRVGCMLSLYGTWKPAFPCMLPELSHWGGRFLHTQKIIETWHLGHLSEQPQSMLLANQCWTMRTASADTAVEDFLSSFGIFDNKFRNAGPRLSPVRILLDLSPLVTKF